MPITFFIGERVKKRIKDAAVEARDAKQYGIARELTIALNDIDAVIKVARGSMRDNEVLKKALRLSVENCMKAFDACDLCPLCGGDEYGNPAIPYGIECGAEDDDECKKQLVKYWIRKAADDAKRDS